MFSLCFLQGQKRALTPSIEERGGFDSIYFPSSDKFKRITFGITFEKVIKDKKKDVWDFYLSLIKLINTTKISDEIVGRIGCNLVLVNRDRDKCYFVDESSLSSQPVLGTDDDVDFFEQKNNVSNSEFAIYQIKDELRYPTAYKINKYFEELAIYPPFDARDSLVRRPQVVRSGTRLAPSGANLFSVLYSIQQDHPSIWGEITEIIQSIYKDFRKFTFPAAGGDGKIIMYLWEKPFQEFGFLK